MTSGPELLSRKEIAALFKRDRITVYRWEREGLVLRDGRATEFQVAYFLEMRDYARLLGISTREMLALSGDAKSRAIHLASELRHATSCNIAASDGAAAAPVN